MNKFLVMVEGGNCLIRGLSKSQTNKYGFYATRYVEAADQFLAESIALQTVESEVLGNNMALNDSSDPPSYQVEETRSIVELEVNVSVAGFTFFPS